MRATIIFMRANGIARRKSDIADPQGARYTGELSLRETTDQGLHRKSTMATLAYSPVLTARQLFDARVVWIEADRMMLTGFERCKTPLGVAEYAQSWLCVFDQTGSNNEALSKEASLAVTV